ncbi:hypothetical protein ACJIZ3_010993 [Penstemon smallii]|uniref:Knl1 C-terminal RWD domain-containing protein n=1 Tax=Penstemon smallii TaxID=265156 RepID=A0ABD3UHV2_9LAMI
MNSKEELNADGPQNNTATENSDGGTTMAMQKKRARRVSFAENTSIRFFEVDDDSKESPSTDTAKFGDHSVNQSELKDFEGEDDEDDEDVMEMRRSFLRPIGSPSPGSSSIRSDSSIDEDNFYGPVSADFIRPGRLSDSDAFVDNDDVTMDSTAFSMHYNSLARSESGVDLKTPTTGKLFFEEKTPTNGNTGSPMSFTLGKKPIPKSSMPVTKVSGSHDSNDMSLVGDKPNKYDFEKLPPGLDAILAEGRNLLSDSVSDDIIASKSPQRIQSEILASTDHGDNLVNGLVSADIGELAEENERLQTFLKDLSAQKFSSSKFPATSTTAHYRPNTSPYQLINNESKTPLVAATSSPVKGHKIIPLIASPSKLLDTPLLVQPGSYLRNESIDHHAGDTSIQKSISKLESLGKSPFSSAFSAKVDSSTIKLLDFSKSPNLNNFLEGNRHVSKINLMQDSVTEERNARVHHSKEKIYALGMHGNGSETPKRVSGDGRFEESLGHLMSQKLRNLSTDQSEYRGAAASPPKVTWTANNMKHSFLTSNRSSEDALMTETDSLLAEIESGEGGQDSVTPTTFVSSPRRILGKGSISPGSQSSKHKDLLHQNQFRQLSEFDEGRGSTPERNLLNANLSTATANKNAVSVEMKGELSSSIVEVSRLKNLIETKPTDGIREVDKDSEMEVVGIMDNFVTPDNEKTMQVMLPKIRDVSNQINQNFSRVEDFLPGGESNVVTPSVCENLDEPRLQSYQNPVELPAASPSRKERDNEHVSSTPSLKSIQLSGKLEKNSANKRSVELLLRDTQHKAEMTVMQRSLKLQKIGICDPETLLYPNGGSKGTTVTGHERKCWTDIYIKLSEDMKQLISLSADKLNFKMIDVMEDLLVYRKRLQMYEMLRSAAQVCSIRCLLSDLSARKHKDFMINTTALHDLQHDIIAETNPLLYQIVFEKAKLQLKHVKQERLLVLFDLSLFLTRPIYFVTCIVTFCMQKRLQLLSSKIQEARRLKTNISSQTLKARTSNVLVDAVSDRSLSDNFQKDHEAKEALDRKIFDLKKTFHVRCGTKSEPNCEDTIALVNEHLMKRAQRRFIRLDMQMWVVHSVGSANGQHNIVLNYLDLILQSIKVIIGPTSSATTSFKLNEANIIKSFPNLDACTAFAFVFNVVTTQKYVGAKILVQETQVTSSLLGSLLDVVEEVQSARMEFQNLTQSNFFSPSVEQLDLMLCFFNFNTGRKVILTLDMSCLKRGIYPSDAIPLQLASPVDRQKCSLSEPIIGEIRDAIKGVRTGYRRIFRLCSCVSQVIQTLKT